LIRQEKQHQTFISLPFEKELSIVSAASFVQYHQLQMYISTACNALITNGQVMLSVSAFSALTLLVGRQEGHPALAV